MYKIIALFIDIYVFTKFDYFPRGRGATRIRVDIVEVLIFF